MDGEISRFARVDRMIAEHGRSQAALIPILQDVQSEFRYLPEDVLLYMATAMRIPAATVFGVATFYAQFSLEPKGKYVIKCCDGTACHVRHSRSIYEAIRAKLGLEDGHYTSPDMKFTVETVSCLGACGLAPVININGEVHGRLTVEAVNVIIDTFLERSEEE